MPQVPSTSSCEHEIHWANLKRSDVEIILKYIPLIEERFQAEKKVWKAPNSLCGPVEYYDFSDLGWPLYKDLAFLGLVTSFRYEQGNIKEDVSVLEKQSSPNPLHCFRLLVRIMQSNGYESVFLALECKMELVLLILQGLERVFPTEPK